MPDSEPVTSTDVYQWLLSDPLSVLRQYDLLVSPLPAVADGTAAQLYFAAGRYGIGIDPQSHGAESLAGCDASDSIQMSMLVSTVRGHALPVGAGPGARHQPTRRTGATQDLWVTELQTGCSVLILDWGSIQSMFDNERRKFAQVIGVRQNGRFEFYRQTQRRNARRAERLAWSGWYSFLPYRSY